MSDVSIDLEAEREASQERRDEELDRGLARNMGERLFWQADDKHGELATRTINDAIAERAGFASFDGERMRRFIDFVKAAYGAVQEKWRTTRPNPSEDPPMTIAEYLEAAAEKSEKRVGHPITRFGQNRLAAHVHEWIERGLEQGVFSGGASGIFYNHIRPFLIARGWEPNISFSHIGPVPEEEWEPIEDTSADRSEGESVTEPDGVDPVQESTQPEEELVDGIPAQQKNPSSSEIFRESQAGLMPESCAVCGCTDLDCRQCIEAQGAPCSWVDLGEEFPLICSRCLRDVMRRSLAGVEGPGAPLNASAADMDVIDLASRRVAGPGPDGTVPVDHARMFLEGPWGSLSVIHPLPLEQGAEASVYLQAQTTQALADRITAELLREKFSFEGATE